MLTLGGVAIRVSSSDRPLLEIDNASYQPFLQARRDPAKRHPDIDIRILAASAPAGDAPVLFESAEVWKVYAEAEGYRLSFYRNGEERPHTIACCDAGTECAQVYVDQAALPGEAYAEMLWNPVRYPLDQILLMNHLAPRAGVIVHAACAVVRGRAVLFPGRSGAGKSTIARLFVAAGLEDAVLSDDRIILRAAREETHRAQRGRPAEAAAWGTPWPGDAGIARNVSAPLGAILFLVKADETALVGLDAGAAMRRLVPLVSGPWYDRERGDQVMATCARLVEDFPCFDLHFRPDDEVVGLVAEGLWSKNSKG